MARDRVLVLFVDALGPEQVAQHGAALAGLPHQRALTGVLGYSSGALATVLTGAEPAAHGRMCLFSAPAAPSGVLAPLGWLGLLPRVVHERGRLRRVLARVLARTAGLTGYVALHRVPPAAFDWLDLPERDDLFTTDAVNGVPTFLADARRAGLSVYAAPWQLPEPQRWLHAHAALARTPPDLTFLYAAELDGTLHRDGNSGRAAAATLQTIGAHLDRARDALSRDGARLTTFVVGDHGMADIREVIDPRPIVAPLRLRLFVDSTMLRFWGDAAALAGARAAVERHRVRGRWLDTAALASRHAPTAGAPYGAAIFVLDEGQLFAPSFVGGRVRGMHGYDLDSGSARAALLADAPLPEGATKLADLAGLVRSKLGLG